MKKDLSDRILPAASIMLAFAGIVMAAFGAVAAFSGRSDHALLVVSGAALVLIAGICWVVYAITGGEPAWSPALRSCERIRAWHRREQAELRRSIMRDLAAMTPEERAKEVERLTDGSSIVQMDIPDKASFLHPDNWPTGRINAPDGLSD
ncbi:MAG TPA: hypothetical protein VL426_06540 [Candidatus Binatia bacterium]|jgi:hypothetical protein|nr:hypothetical protein [Candidatus Binatia bacterium]